MNKRIPLSAAMFTSESALCAFIVLAVLILSGQAAARAEQPLSDTDRQKIKTFIAAYAKAHVPLDASAVAAAHADDAISMPPDEKMVRGRAEVLKSTQAGVNQGWTINELVITPIEIFGGSDLAYVVSTTKATATPPGSTTPISGTGKEVKILRKQADGAWKIAVDIWNWDQPLPTTPPGSTTGNR